MADITLKINGVEVTVPTGTTVLEAAHKANIDIPTLCYLKGINEVGDCRMNHLPRRRRRSARGRIFIPTGQSWNRCREG